MFIKIEIQTVHTNTHMHLHSFCFSVPLPEILKLRPLYKCETLMLAARRPLCDLMNSIKTLLEICKLSEKMPIEIYGQVDKHLATSIANNIRLV